ncbi:MAG: flagellar hook-basal body complex protein [Elusimicrobia bacterium]|nr:flagellar hook-basal body complex protein [Elusimicrobiota bacterium]
MMPALFSGVSGLKNHQFRMNVIGNNLSNVNTIGFKYNRVSFGDLVYQTIRDASAPQAVGGTNPVQLGLGSFIHSVDSINTQGNLESTGRSTDMSLQGEGYFVVNDGTRNKYSRAGLMELGLGGNLVNPSDGSVYMGWNAVNSVVDTSQPIEELSIPVGDVLPAQRTGRMTFNGNLDAAGTLIQGTIAQTPPLLAYAGGTTLASDLRNSAGAALGLAVGTSVSISGSVGGTLMAAAPIVVNAGTTLANIAAAIQAALRGVADGDLTETATVQADGSIRVTSDAANAITNLQLSVPGNTLANNAFQFPLSIAGGGATGDSEDLLRPAVAADELVDIMSSSGVSLGLVAGDDVTLISANVKSSIIASAPVLSNILGTTTYDDYRTALRTALFTGAPAVGEDLVIDSDGSLLLTGSDGALNAITGLVLGAGPNPTDDLRPVFSASQSYGEVQAAQDATSYRTSTQVFDSLGNPLGVDFRFSKNASNSWQWAATYDGNSVGNGVMNFDSAGTLVTPQGSISIPLANGAASPLAIAVDFTGCTQFTNDSSIVLNTQDGFSSATLSGFSIGQEGDVVGTFSNGRNLTLGQLAVATFRNPAGLKREGRNFMSESSNSGTAEFGAARSGGRGTIISGTLEMSNVDVAREFTDMIVTQRGFQSNARVITTSDQMLEELVNLKR